MAHDHEKEPEDLAVEAYMDQIKSSPEAPSEKDRKEYLKARYEFIKAQAIRLQLEKHELESVKADQKQQMLANIRTAFAENYKVRKYCVTELRKLGEKIEDQFIPNSAT
jgi:hypothetical protein